MSPSKTPLFYINVVPLTSVPLTRDPKFSYVASQPIAIGSLVHISFGTKKLPGIVIESHSTRPKTLPVFVKLKPIEKIVQEGFLTSEQIALAYFISRTCFTPLGICLKHFTPTPTKSRTSKKSLEIADFQKPERDTTIHQPTPPQQKIIQHLAVASSHPYALFGPPASGKTETILFAMRDTLAPDSQALLLVPERSLIDTERKRLNTHWKESEIAVIHSHLSAGELSSAWERIRSGQARVILGTRQALFAPFRRLDFIALDDEHSESYKQWAQSPRYDSRLIVQELARLHHARLVFIASTPSLWCWSETQQEHFTALTLPHRAHHSPPHITLVDLKLERWKKNFSSLSQPLIEALRVALARKHQALLFVNHRGMSHFSVCTHCKTVLRCMRCDHALVLNRSGVYQCLHCDHKTDEFLTCQKCRGSEFRNIGIGTERVERELEQKFPYAKIGRLDKSIISSPTKLAATIKDFTNGKIDILIGTQTAILGWNLPKLKLIGIIDADSLFSLPGFRNDEKAFQILTQAIHRSGRSNDASGDSQAIIQTFHPENSAFANVEQSSIDEYFSRLLEDRETLGYPPAWNTLLFMCRQTTQRKLDASVKKLYNSLLDTLKQPSYKKFKISLLSETRQRDTFCRNILLRYPKTASFQEDLQTTVRTLPGEWTLDTTPLDLF